TDQAAEAASLPLCRSRSTGILRSLPLYQEAMKKYMKTKTGRRRHPQTIKRTRRRKSRAANEARRNESRTAAPDNPSVHPKFFNFNQIFNENLFPPPLPLRRWRPGSGERQSF